MLRILNGGRTPGPEPALPRAQPESATPVRRLPQLPPGWHTQALGEDREPVRDHLDSIGTDSMQPRKTRLYRRSGEVFTLEEGCPNNGDRYRRHRVEPLLKAVACRQSRCSYCGRVKIVRSVAALSLAEPGVFFTVTRTGTTASEVTAGMTTLMVHLRKRSPAAQQAWAAEWNSAGDQSHVHGWLFAYAGNQWDLSEAARKSGFGSEADLRPRRDNLGFRYIFKDGLASQERRDGHLLINGGRFLHNGRGFFRDGPGGSVIPDGIDGVSALLRSRNRGERDEENWILCEPGSFERVPESFVQEFN